jgi:hypothetical protein
VFIKCGDFIYVHLVVDNGLETVEAITKLSKRVSKLEVMFGSLKEVKETKMAMEAEAIAKLDKVFGRGKKAKEPHKQNEVILIDSDSSLEFYEDTLKKPSNYLVNKRPHKTWGKKIPISCFKKNKGSTSKPKMVSWYLPTKHSSSSDYAYDSSSSDESNDAKGHVQVKKRSLSKVSSPRSQRIKNCVLLEAS